MPKPKDMPGYLTPSSLKILALATLDLKDRVTEALGLSIGGRALDIGCGPGIDTVSMARIVGNTGLVVGIDCDPEMIQEATRCAKAQGVGDWARYELSNAEALPFDDGFFDACRIDRVLQHIETPSQALSEIARVTKALEVSEGHSAQSAPLATTAGPARPSEHQAGKSLLDHRLAR